MGNALYSNWGDPQHLMYGYSYSSSMAVSIAFGTVLTQYCVFEWIWNSKMTKTKTTHSDHNSPAFLVSLFMFWAIWSIIFTFNEAGIVAYLTKTEENTLAQRIALPIVSFLGFFVNLIFASLWKYTRRGKVDHDEEITIEDASADDTKEARSSYERYTTPNLEEETKTEEPDIEEAAPLSTTPRPAKVTVDYINNIKIFLTWMVIIFHCACSFDSWPGLMNMTQNPHNWGSVLLGIFVSTCDSYFMNLFFFYSGFFVPKSFDKKGRYDFLFDRVKRLGIPFVVQTLILGPYVFAGFMHLFWPTHFKFPMGIVDWGTTWFLNQLMLFSVVYAFACGKNWHFEMACPSLLGFFTIALVIGLLTGIVNLFTPGGDNFLAVPGFWEKYLPYPLYFFGGAVAQRNGWMENIKEKSRLVIYSSAAVLIAALNGLKYVDMPSTVGVLLLNGVLNRGLLSMGVSLAVSVFFMDHANRKYWCTDFFAKAMYTAYIIQYIFPTIAALKIAFTILDATGNLAFTEAGEGYITNDNLIFPIWLLVATISNLILWPLAYAIRSIPGFSKVL